MKRFETPQVHKGFFRQISLGLFAAICCFLSDDH